MKIKKLEPDATPSDMKDKINELIDVINSISQSAYITPGPSPYDLSAVGKYLKRHRK